MDRQDRETRRAENQVWNGWGDYARKPELLTFDRAGDAELYGNTVLGLACRYYDFDRFRPLLNEFHRSAQEALYTDIFFLVLEGAVFARGAAERPLLPALRRDYARRLLAQTPVAEGMNGDAVRRAWACRVLGQPEDPALSPLLDELAAPGDSTEAQLIQRTERVLYTWFRRARRAAACTLCVPTPCGRCHMTRPAAAAACRSRRCSAFCRAGRRSRSCGGMWRTASARPC